MRYADDLDQMIPYGFCTWIDNGSFRLVGEIVSWNPASMEFFAGGLSHTGMLEGHPPSALEASPEAL